MNPYCRQTPNNNLSAYHQKEDFSRFDRTGAIAITRYKVEHLIYKPSLFCTLLSTAQNIE